MPISGLSLVGFLTEKQALNYFQTACYFSGTVDLSAEYDRAAKRIVSAERPGRPVMKDIPQQFQERLEEVTRHPRFQLTVNNHPYAFKLVEIAPLLAFQQHVKSPQPVKKGTQTALDALINECLPREQPDAVTIKVVSPRSMTFVAPDFNFKILGNISQIDTNQKLHVISYLLGMSSPLMYVGVFGERAVLLNGYHRATKWLKAGQQELPCLVVYFTDAEMEDSINPIGAFSTQLLCGDAPPTVGHFMTAAHPVQLRRYRRVVRLSWDEELLPEE